MSELALRFLGVGNSQAVALGSSAVVLERGEQPLLLVDCGPGTLEGFWALHGELPRSLFITHAHLDHIGGLEGLYYRLATAPEPPAPV